MRTYFPILDQVPISLHIAQGVGHEITTGMWDAVDGFLQLHLLSGELKGECSQGSEL